MRAKFLIVLVLLSSLILLPGLAAAQEPEKPEEIVQMMVEAEIIDNAAGELVVEVGTETIDLTDEDNLFRYLTYEGALADFVMGGTITWGPGATDDDCGFVLRYADDSNYYYAGIDQQGQVRFDEIQDGEWQEPVLEETALITNGEGEANEFIVLAVGGDFQVFVNRTAVLAASDDSVAEGEIGLAMDTYENSAATNCVFDNVWGWNLTGVSAASGGDGGSGEVQLAAYDQTPKEAIAELQDLDLIPGSASQVFLEDYAYFTGVGSWFTPLARQSPFTNVVMGGELTFTIGTTTEMETCALMARVVLPADNSGTTTYTEVGLANTGEVYVMDVVGGENVQSASFPLDLDLKQPHHLLFIVNDNTVTLFVDGEMVADQFEINAAHKGTYGISLLGKGDNARCDGKNIWVYELD